MNPWDLAAWAGAISVTLIITALTALVVVATVRSLTNKTRTNRIL